MTSTLDINCHSGQLAFHRINQFFKPIAVMQQVFTERPGTTIV